LWDPSFLPARSMGRSAATASLAASDSRNVCIQRESGTLVRLARRLYGEFLNEDALSPLAIEGLTLEMLAAPCRRQGRAMKSQAPIWLKHVKDLLHERCTENLSIETIAQAADVHAAHLCRTFRRHHHCTLGD